MSQGNQVSQEAAKGSQESHTDFKLRHYASELKAQCDRDAIWCQACGMANMDEPKRAVPLAVAQIMISGHGIETVFPLCRSCHAQRMAKPLPNDVGSEPVVQPAYIATARQLIQAIRESL